MLQRDLNVLIKADKKFCYGCIQSVIIVLDGDFLRLPKFVSMVNGGTSEYALNDRHGMYVFSDKYSGDRIYSTNLELENFREHAVKAADYWLRQRQWLDMNWRAL